MEDIITIKHNGIEGLKDLTTRISRQFSRAFSQTMDSWSIELNLYQYDKSHNTRLYAEYKAKQRREHEKQLRLSVGL